MSLSCNRGGRKPDMLSGPHRQEVPFSMHGRAKYGVYERNQFRLARRVELPAWMYEGVLKGTVKLSGSGMRMPPEEIGESRGQIFVSPPRHLFSGPAVGMDMEVFTIAERCPTLTLIEFYVYGSAYRLVDVLQITRKSFVEQAKEVGTKASFMPQMMVELTSLRSRLP